MIARLKALPSVPALVLRGRAGARLAGRRWLVRSISTLAVTTAAAPLIALRDLRTVDPSSDDLPTEPVGAVRTIHRPDGTRLSVRVGGLRGAHGPTFVFTHGLSCDHRLWSYQSRMLGELGRVVTWDLRGHGSSALGEPDAFDAATLAADLSAVIESAASGPVFLIGHSLGGMLSLLVLRDNPAIREHVAGALLIATPATDISRSVVTGGGLGSLEAAIVRRVFLRLAGGRFTDRGFIRDRGFRLRSYSAVRAGGFGVKPSRTHINSIREQVSCTHPVVRRATLNAMCGVDLRGTLAEVRTPTLFVVGGRDRLVNPRQTLALASELPHARSVVFEGAGHAVVLERHAAITRRIALLAQEVLAGDGDLDLVAAAPRT